MQLALGALAVYNLRPSVYAPVEEVNILWTLEGGLHIRAHSGVLFTYHRFSWRTFEGVFSSSALRRIKEKKMALEGLFRKHRVATGRDRDFFLRRLVALGVPRGVEDDPAMDVQWFEHLRASATAMEPCSTKSRGTSVPLWLTPITTCTSPCHTPPATLSWPLTRIGCWSSSAPPS